jgi:hypothetical protein
MIILNDADTNQQFNIKFKNKILATALQGYSVATYIW